MIDTGPHHLTVEGMTCAHCERAVRQAVGAIPGVSDVAVDLASGRLSWNGSTAAVQQIREAVETEGYTVRAQTSA